MISVAWFVEEALKSTGTSPAEWESLPQDQQIKIIQDWQARVGTKDDYVKRANFQTVKKNQMETIQNTQDLSYDDFAKLDIRVGTIIDAERVLKSKKLMKLRVSFGELGERIILAGIHPDYDVPQLIKTQVLAVLNLAPRDMMGITSHGMILASRGESGELRLTQCPGAKEGEKVG